jgi:hypothetical protein
MSKIVKNTTGSAYFIADTGISIPASSQYTIQPQDYLLWAASSDVIVGIGSSDLVINDGSSDLSINDGTKLIQGIFPNPVGVAAGDDGTAIGHVGDAIKVTGGDDGVSTDPTPGRDVIYKDVRVLNGSSKNIAVDGDPINVNFDFTPASGETWYIESISFFCLDSGSMDYDDFVTISGGLDNGLQILIRSNGTEYEYANLQDNGDISLVFAGTGQAGEDGSGWLDQDDYFFGRAILNVPIKIANSTSDYIRFKVRDDLDSITTIQASVLVWRVI